MLLRLLFLLLLLSLLETSLAIASQMEIAAEFGPVSRTGPCLKPPKPHESNKLSGTARDQSICPRQASQSNQKKSISWPDACPLPIAKSKRREKTTLFPALGFLK